RRRAASSASSSAGRSSSTRCRPRSVAASRETTARRLGSSSAWALAEERTSEEEERTAMCCAGLPEPTKNGSEADAPPPLFRCALTLSTANPALGQALAPLFRQLAQNLLAGLNCLALALDGRLLEVLTLPELG